MRIWFDSVLICEDRCERETPFSFDAHPCMAPGTLASTCFSCTLLGPMDDPGLFPAAFWFVCMYK